MKFLPLVMTRGPLLAEVMRGAAGAARHSAPCGWCGTPIPLRQAGRQQTARCPSCARSQQISSQEEEPWRLAPGSVEALRRTRTWLRRL
ncbi:MAG: hypothetical protein U1E70_17630 [Acetobacteraceae bacterium]|nr:hypothetical protein [Pseudomonadota bacterium]